VAEGQGGGYSRTSKVGLPPTPNPSPQGGGEWVGVCRAILRALAFVALFLAITPAHTVQPDEILKDPALEARARHLSQELRCLVCQNQSIDDSNAELARDLRVLVRERLTAGDSDDAVLAYVEARYGEFVLLRPRWAPHTAVLWLAPVLLLAGTIVFVWRRMRARGVHRGSEAAPLSADEQRRLDRMLAGDGIDRPGRKR